MCVYIYIYIYIYPQGPPSAVYMFTSYARVSCFRRCLTRSARTSPEVHQNSTRIHRSFKLFRLLNIWNSELF